MVKLVHLIFERGVNNEKSIALFIIDCYDPVL